MEKKVVTRTISIGAICNGTKTIHSDGFSAARRHSSAGIRALLWASSAKSFGTSLGSESQTSRDNICANILTPDSIPQFTIPSLSVQAASRSLENNTDRQTEEGDAETSEDLGSPGRELEMSSLASPTCSMLSSSSVFRSALSDRRAERSISDPLSQRRSTLQREASLPYSYMEAQHCLDPASRAALSLPHLTKVTTPYGFVTLSQSPQMASEEALLCQAGLRRLNKDEEITCSYSKAPVTRTAAINIKGNSYHQKQSPSKDFTNSQTEGRIQTTTAFTTTSGSSSSTPKQAASSKIKQRFYEIIRKDFLAHH